MKMRWMLQHKDDKLPFDYRQAQCLVPTLRFRDYARAFQLFSGLSNFVTLRSQGDESFVFSRQGVKVVVPDVVTFIPAIQ